MTMSPECVSGIILRQRTEGFKLRSILGPFRTVFITLWQITNPSARDFRLTTIGPRWTSTPPRRQGAGEYVRKVAPPKRGWTAYLVELTFVSGTILYFGAGIFTSAFRNRSSA